MDQRIHRGEKRPRDENGKKTTCVCMCHLKMKFHGDKTQMEVAAVRHSKIPRSRKAQESSFSLENHFLGFLARICFSVKFFRSFVRMFNLRQSRITLYYFSQIKNAPNNNII